MVLTFYFEKVLILENIKTLLMRLPRFSTVMNVVNYFNIIRILEDMMSMFIRGVEVLLGGMW